MNKHVKNLTLTAMFLAIGLVLPFLTGQLQQIGNMLLPMHIPVFLCALICGWKWGLPMAIILPLMRSLIFGMPPLYPTAVAMAFELGTYAFVAGFLYEKSKWTCIRALYRCMLIAMVAAVVCGLGVIELRESLAAAGNTDAWNTINNLLFADISAAGNEKAVGLFYLIGQLFVKALQL